MVQLVVVMVVVMLEVLLRCCRVEVGTKFCNVFSLVVVARAVVVVTVVDVSCCRKVESV